MKNRISFLLGLSLLLIVASSAHAQAPQTWVSGVGDDFNPCTRTAPCLTFAGAISKTAAGGEITALDPGDFGNVVVTKSITIDGGSTRAGITAPATNGVIVNVFPTLSDPGVVILRGLSINGDGDGLNGIRYLAGATLIIEQCSIYGFTLNDIEVSTASGNLVVKNTTLTRADSGIHLTSTTGTGTLAQVTSSLIVGNTGYGLRAEGKGTISVANSLLTNNGVAVQADPFATVRLSNNEIFDNLTDIGCGGGTVASWKNNRIVVSVVPACAPLAHITEK